MAAAQRHRSMNSSCSGRSALTPGGACWNDVTCALGTAKSSVNVKSTISGLNSGIHDGTNPENPVAEWNHLYVPYCSADVHAGNLLILKDGRVAFIDFGIVGSIPPQTASAMLDFVKCYAVQDFEGLAAALAQMGFTKQGVDTKAFAADLKEVLDSADAAAPQLAAGAVDETQLNRLVAAIAKVAGNYGIKFPREFALLVKQVLYFDRYTPG